MRKIMTAQELFEQYLDELQLQWNGKTQKRVQELTLGAWNFYFFTKLGISKKCEVWCNNNKLKVFQQEFGDGLWPHEFLWDLGWFVTHDYSNNEIESCPLALEQEISEVKDARWYDFQKLLYAEVTHLRVFIGHASKKEFNTVPTEYAVTYSKNGCHKENQQFLLILFNITLSGLKIGGWVLNSNGTATQIAVNKTKKYFNYPN